ncbi:hypothetical protein NP233_g3918 [Leucocoprinus birnbaumii]|uniref:Ferritin-like domain-containing protein n=1 Tax=Leucocoprinus birnbaumii TaxID=56174 RepID=A0AAD5VVP9_9AGAR|nr:hypothetical protein NP233_g3918 [Leucocoprinus birnbaumii]
MHLSSFVSLALAVSPLLVSAAPARFYGKRQSDANILVMQFADVLEQLESGFYSQALQKFQQSDFTSAGFSSSDIPIQQFTIIQQDESTHSTVLQSALKAFGASPITSCKFKFDSALTDVATMAATARVVENVGVMAYLGGATLINDPIILDAAGSILTVEARHQTILNLMSGSGTAIPSAFDLALTPSEVLAIASPFFDGACDLGIPANPTLSITNTGSVGPGTLLSFSSSAMNGTTDGMFCQMMLGGATMSIPLPLSQCVVPDGINGPVAIWITSDGQPLLNNVRDRATTQLVAGPTLAFIDTQSQSLGQLVRNSGAVSSGSSSSGSSSNSGSSGSSSSSDGSGSSGSTSSSTDTATASASTSTTTISPDEASSIIASISASATATASATASGTDSAAAASPTVNNPAANTTPGGPNMFTGTSPDGHTSVVGWQNLPPQAPQSSSS